MSYLMLVFPHFVWYLTTEGNTKNMFYTSSIHVSIQAQEEKVLLKEKSFKQWVEDEDDNTSVHYMQNKN